MKPLVSMVPIRYPELGIESFSSLLMRLASLYGASLHQILRYLCESKEVSDLVGEAPFRSAVDSPRTLNGYAVGTQSLTRRVEAAMGVRGIGATTLKRIGPALTTNVSGATAPKRRYCPLCVEEMKCSETAIVWEPLVWTLPMLTCCPVHDEPLYFASNERGELDTLKDHLSPYPLRERRDRHEDWCYAESLRLMAFCAEDPEDFVINDAPKAFLNTYMQSRNMGLADFCQITGLPYGNFKRHATGEMKFTLRTVFGVAQRLALSPTSLLAEPVETALSEGLFSLAEHAINVATSATPCRRPMHDKQVYSELLGDMQRLLASKQPLPSLRSICHARGVSTGYARHALSTQVAEFIARRLQEASDRRMRLKLEAKAAVAAARGESETSATGLKRTERVLREKTGLPKHLLMSALHKAVSK